MGVPVFLSDVKGEIPGMCKPGIDSEKMQERISRFGIENWRYAGFPTRFWDIFGEKGHPVRIIADDNGLLLLDMKVLP